MDNLIKHSRERNNLLVCQQINEKPRLAFAMPNALTIEPGAICPLRCVSCPQADSSFGLTRDLLSLDDFKKIIDSFEGYLEHVNLFNWGEPLLNPDISSMVRYASERKIYTVIHSNLNFLNPASAEALVTSGLSSLTASIDGASEESYSKYRVNGSFSTAIKNLKLLINIKKRLGLSNLKIYWQFLVFRHNEHEIDVAKVIADDLGVEINFKFAVVTKKEFESTLDDYNGKDFLKKFVHDYDSPCLALWRNPVIHPGGMVLPCCMIFQVKYAVGNLFSEDFKNIWNNDKYQELRDIITGRSHGGGYSFCHYCIFNPVKCRDGIN